MAEQSPAGADISALQHELDAFYAEMLELPKLDPDAALRRLASLLAWGNSARGRLGRTGSRAALVFCRNELDVFLATVESQARLVERSVSLARAARR